jgi:hypothetical protein
VPDAHERGRTPLSRGGDRPRSSFIVALADRRDPLQAAVRDVLVAEPGNPVIPAPVTAEVDYLLGRRIGRATGLAFVDDLAAGCFAVECLELDEYATKSAAC